MKFIASLALFVALASAQDKTMKMNNHGVHGMVEKSTTKIVKTP
jgi:hypothetical protein